MIPSLIDQVIAARIPSIRLQGMTSKRQEKLDRVHSTMRSLGNVSARKLAEKTGLSDKAVRELLAELQAEGRVYSWKPSANQNDARLWGVAK